MCALVRGTADYCARASTACSCAASAAGSQRPPKTPARNGEGAAAASSSTLSAASSAARRATSNFRAKVAGRGSVKAEDAANAATNKNARECIAAADLM